ncbi:MAG: transposase, partial [Planctomycetaceae bacterium]|nr:transposase [Planctomycetaceae bacterium]
ADGGYAGQFLRWLYGPCGGVSKLVKRNECVEVWQLLPRRWVVEQSLSWLKGDRRLSRDDESWPETSETMIQVAMIHLMLHRLTLKTLAS